MNRQKVVVGMSGGVDSSTSIYLLQKSGYEVVGVTLNHKKEKSLEKEIETAKKMADFFGIEHMTIDIEDIFQNEVIDNFLDGYSRGITPSPCIICDEKVKLKILFDVAESLGAYYVATGHYCKVEYAEEFSKVLLKKARDSKKDQSYMLYRIGTEKIERLLFPLADYTKEEIRKIAQNIGLEVYDKKDSQGICFAKSGYIDFLKNNLKDEIKEGNFVDRFGNILGKHRGYQLYTIGQRRGLELKLPRPYFIVKIVPQKNEIVLGEFEELAQKKVELVDFVSHIDMDIFKNITLVGRPRFSSGGARGRIVCEEDKIYFEYLEPNTQNASGQHLVLYCEDVVLGGGMIR